MVSPVEIVEITRSPVDVNFFVFASLAVGVFVPPDDYYDYQTETNVTVGDPNCIGRSGGSLTNGAVKNRRRRQRTRRRH